MIGITMGDPAGIGAEVVVKALADPAIRRLARFEVFGMNELMSYAADLAEIEPFWWRVQHDSPRTDFKLVHNVVVRDYDEFSMLGQTMHRPSKQGGIASLTFLDDAIAATPGSPPATSSGNSPGNPPRRALGNFKGKTRAVSQTSGGTSGGGIDALVTAPICKESWKLAGCRFPGHTELLAHRVKAKRVVMMFASPKLNVALATVHIPLMDVRNVLTIGRVFDPIDLGHQACQRMGIENPRIAVCGLNPHASENGLFGDEEKRLIKPAIDMAREHGIDVHGPFPADTVFLDAVQKRYDLVVAMYHDQGLIPVKLLGFDEAVNMTLGLPLLRTSVDHGTAFNLVGKNKADPGSMKAAIRLAVKMSLGSFRTF